MRGVVGVCFERLGFVWLVVVLVGGRGGGGEGGKRGKRGRYAESRY